MSQRQHTVPKTYLRGFSDAKGQLRGFDRERQRTITTTIGNASVVSDIYRIPGALNSDEALMVERILSENESVVAPTFEKIRNGQSAVEPQDHFALAEFIGLQWLRTMKVFDAIQELGDWYAKIWLSGLTREDVAQRLREKGMDDSEGAIGRMMEFVEHPEQFRAVPPKGSFLIAFLSTYEKTLPLLMDGWKWLVVRSGARPFITSDGPVILIGDTINGGLGLASAEELWLPVGRRHAIVLSRDFSLPSVILDVRSDHIRRINQRIALEAHRWLYWHPDDDALRAIDAPSNKGKLVQRRSVGWRNRPDGMLGEIINFSATRMVVTGEHLLSGRTVVDRQATVRGLSTREEVIAAARARTPGSATRPE